MASPQREEWLKAIADEKESFRSSDTFTPVTRPLPVDVEASLLDTKWVFKLKRDESGKIVRFKARLVARGFKQREEDYDITFSPTLGMMPLRALIAIAALHRMDLVQADFTAAYLNPLLDKNVLIKMPPGFDE